MKFVLDCRYVRPKPSGIGAYVRGLASRLPTLAPDDHFEFWVDPSAPDPIPSGPNVTLRPVQGDPLGPGTYLWPQWLAPLEDADVFHSPQNIIGRGLSCPTVVTVHDTMWLTSPALVEGNALLRAVNWPFLAGGAWHALRRATRLLAVSEATADSIRAFYPPASQRLRVALNGVESAFCPPADPIAVRNRAIRLLGTAAPFILVLGTNQPYKGHEYAVRAFARAAAGNTRLVFVQRHGGRSGLGQLAKSLGIHDRVLFLDALPRPDIITLLQSTLALFHPSLVEGFGLPTLEAAACGAPVIASDIPVLREVLGDAALLTPPTDVAGYAKSIEQITSNADLRDKLRACGLSRAATFTWDACARSTLLTYREAAASKT